MSCAGLFYRVNSMKNFEAMEMKSKTLDLRWQIVVGKYGHVWIVDRAENTQTMLMEVGSTPAALFLKTLKQSVPERFRGDVIDFVGGLNE